MFDGQSLLESLYPRAEARLKRLRLEAIKDPFKGVMCGRTVRQFQGALQPVAPFATKEFDLVPVLGTGKNGTEGDDDDVLKQVQAAVRPPGILELAEVIGDGQGVGRAVASGGRYRHDSPP
jgi:SAM-dependent methyltransferase